MWAGQLILEGGGFCGCRRDGLSVNLKGYDGLAIRVKGDGSRYKMNIKTGGPLPAARVTLTIPVCLSSLLSRNILF